jgi:hypothetical protein
MYTLIYRISSFKRNSARRKDGIKTNLMDPGWENVDWIWLAEYNGLL